MPLDASIRYFFILKIIQLFHHACKTKKTKNLMDANLNIFVFKSN